MNWLFILIERLMGKIYPSQTAQSAPTATSTPVAVSDSTPTSDTTSRAIVAVSQDKPDMLTIFATAIRDFEGGPGDLNYQLNNPGDCRCSSVGYLPKYGTVQCIETSKGKFARFSTYELGWEYLQALILNWAQLHPQWTIDDFFMQYSPPSDNNPTDTYALFVAKRCGVAPTMTLGELFAVDNNA